MNRSDTNFATRNEALAEKLTAMGLTRAPIVDGTQLDRSLGAEHAYMRLGGGTLVTEIADREEVWRHALGLSCNFIAVLPSDEPWLRHAIRRGLGDPKDWVKTAGGAR